MNYTERLNKIIKESGLTQKQICDKCKELGEEVTATYLSVLKNNDGKIASETISRTIAVACGAKYPEILVIQAYLDRAPKYIIEFLEEVRCVNEQGAKVIELGIQRLPENLMGFTEAIEKAKEQTDLAEFICEHKGKLSMPMDEFNEGLSMMKELDIADIIYKKLATNQNYLLIPISDMGNAKIIKAGEANYIKELLEGNATK